ncbi:MAG: hypothetical protein K5637_04560 [Lachnospiraceae bacterium]|nr:hypothetical protein [Lachnospiraceae bacterium]
MLRIEMLYPEAANLYGDRFNAWYLQKSCPGSTVISTSFSDVPAFAKGEADIVCMGGAPEIYQEKAIAALMPYRSALQECIDKGTIFLFTGNAVEAAAEYIENEDGSRIGSLGLTKLYAKRDRMNRYNSIFLGSFDGGESGQIEIAGFRSQSSMMYGDNSSFYAFASEKGCGINRESTLAGVRLGNFFGTYLLGPLLPMNPEFTRYILRLAGENEAAPAFEKEAAAAFEARLMEFRDPHFATENLR